MRIAKTNTIPKRPANKLFTVDNTFHDTNQIGQAREQKLRPKENIWMLTDWTLGGGEVFEHYKINLWIRFNKIGEIFPSITRVLSIFLTTADTSPIVERISRPFPDSNLMTSMKNSKLYFERNCLNSTGDDLNSENN